MTTQPRGLSTPGYQPSPSQPIPNRYSHPPPLFGSGGQAYSPRHVVPSSSPHQPQYFQQAGFAGSAHDPRHAVPSSSPYQQQYVHQAGIAGSAHDPRHVVPSSSPYQQQYYQQAGIAGNAHDMYKGPGVVGTGTPPMMMDNSTYRDHMSLHYYPNPTYFWQSQCPNIRQSSTLVQQSQQQYYNGGHRPRGPIPGARGMYYHTVLQRYPNIQGQTSPAQYQQYPNQPHYQYMPPQAPQITHNQAMYGPAAYQPQYGQQPPPQQIGSVQAQAMMPQQPSSQKRERKAIRIVDPNTNEDVNLDIIRSQRQDSLSTPPSGRSSATPPTGDVAAKFAAQVAAAAGTSAKSASPLTTPPVDTQPMMINQNSQQMHQMQQEQQIVGSPNRSIPMVSPYMSMPGPASSPRPPNMPPLSQPMQQEQQIVGSPNRSIPMVSPYMNMPGPASSPRPPNIPPLSQPVMMPQQYVQQMPPYSTTYPPQMLSASPGHAATPPQAQHGQMSMSPQMLNQMPSYQLPSQQQTEQFGRSTHPPIRLMTSNIPDNVHTYPARPQQVNIASGEPAVPTQPPSRPLIQQPPQAVPVVQTTARAQMSKDIVQTDITNVALQQTDSASVAARLVASPSPKEQEPIQSISDATQNGKSTIEVLPSVPSVQSEGANTADNAAVSSETLVDDVAIIHLQEVLTNTVAEKLADARPVEPVPSMPEKTEQTLEKEDTAIRLEDETLSSIPGAEHKPASDAGANVISGVNPPFTTAHKDTDTSKLSTETAGDVKSLPDSDVAPSLPTPETEAVKQEASGSSTPVTKILVTSPTPTKVGSLQSTEEAPVPSAKTTVEKLDNETELPPVQSQTQGQPKVAEKQPSKSMVKLPEPSKVPISESSEPVRKDSTSSDRQQKPLISSQNVSENPVANGLDTSTESESGDLTKITEKELPSVKITKTADVKQTSESKSPQPKDEPPISLSITSEKSSSEKGTESEKTNGVAPGKSKLTAEIKYQGDQWSPQNPKGKRQYDSTFLLQFQYRPTSLEKPKDLPNIDIVLEQPHNKTSNPMQPMEMRSGTDFTPNYVMRGPGPRRPVRQTSRDHGKGRSPYSGPAPRIIQKVVSIDRDVQLKTTENAWKPIKRDKNLTTKIAGDELEILEVIREVRAILNKLTPNTFAALMKKVLSLKIDTERKLRGTIDLIFEKAIDEPNFSEAYANMCRQMSSIRVTPDEASGAAEQTVEFRKLLLTKCQKEFEKNKSDQENLLELKKKMEANTNKEIEPQLQEEYALAETRERRRTLGNIRFIGELYKLRMLTETIMHNCIMALFKARDDDHLESLCRLLTTIGKDLDHQKGKQRMDQYFEQLKKLIQEKRTSTRVRFMLQDVYDLRLNNWVPRAITTQGPKTISQIHQDAKQEQELLQLKLATTAAPAMKQGGRQQNRMGNRGHGEDGWTKVQTPAKPTRYDPTKMKLNQFDDTKITLGPSRGYGAGWKSGSAGSGLSKTGSGGYSPSGSMDKTQETGRSNTPTSMKNRFSALSQAQGQASDYDNTRRSGGRQSSREGSRTGSRGSMGPPSSGSVSRTPHKDERSSVLEAARRLTSTERNYESRPKSSRESSPSVKSRTSTPRPQQTTHKYNVDLDEEKMQQKSKNILVEFLSIVDFKEATECIEELNAPPSLMHALVHIAHEFTLEKKREDRTNIGRFMAHLLKLGRLSVEQYVKGLANLLEMATDYEIDVPMVWEYIAEQMSPVFEDDNEEDVPLSCLAELAAPLSDEDKSGIFVAEVVKAVIKRVSLEVFAQRWQKSNMLWSKIINKSAESVEAFLAQHNLSELSDSKGPSGEQGGATGQSTSGVVAADEQYRLEQEITKLLEDGLSNEDIFIWVENNVPLVNVTEPPFLRALTIAVCKKAMDAEGKNVVEDRISERGIVLKKYIDSDPERELQAVYALQHMMVILDQPANVLRKFFDVLYNEDVITEQTFYKWEKCADPNEQEGRGVAVASVNPFFTWLRTAEPESD